MINLNRNSERIPAEGPANKYGGRTCGGVSEQIKNRLYIPYGRRFPVRSAAGSFKRCIGLFVLVTFVLVSGISALAKDEVKININKATVKELTKLKKVGPKVAEKIVDFREKNGPFKKPEDIMKVSGIGPKIFEQNKDIIIIGDKP